MYTGPTDNLVPWFKSLGYYHDLQEHGVASDWALDLVSLGFTKPQQLEEPAATDAVDAPEGTDEQQPDVQHQGSVRYRGVGAAPPPAAATNSVQLQRQPSMMSSQQELATAAEKFLKNLLQQHPEWLHHDASAAAAGATGASSSTTASTTGAVYGAPAFGPNSSPPVRGPSPQRWWEDSVPPTKQALADSQQQQAANDVADHAAGDQDVGPPQQVMQQKLNAATVQVETAKEADDAGPFAQRRTQQSLLATEHEKPGLLSRIMTAFHKYRALLWRELLITTRCGSRHCLAIPPNLLVHKIKHCSIHCCLEAGRDELTSCRWRAVGFFSCWFACPLAPWSTDCRLSLSSLFPVLLLAGTLLMLVAA